MMMSLLEISRSPLTPSLLLEQELCLGIQNSTMNLIDHGYKVFGERENLPEMLGYLNHSKFL